MRKPNILIYGNVFETSVGQGSAYMEFFSQFGDVFIVHSEMDIAKMISLGDILALPGGMDVGSGWGEPRKPGFNTRHFNAHYEYLDRELLLPWLKTQKPIIGICRGMQVLNLAMGGTIIRHIDGHVQDKAYDRHEVTHLVSLNHSKVGTTYTWTNTYHHQCLGKLADGFELLGWSEFESTDRKAMEVAEYHRRYYFETKKGYERSSVEVPVVPEIMKHHKLPYIAFQYHPEEFNCPVAVALIEDTLKDYTKAEKPVEQPKYVL